MKSRRLLLKSILGLPLIFAFKQKAQAKTVTRAVMLNRCSIAGFQYYDGKACIQNLKQNDPLSLLAEPANNYDKYAVEVYYQTNKLGYIPKTDNKHISRILQAGGELTVKVEAIDADKVAWNAVRVSVYMNV